MAEFWGIKDGKAHFFADSSFALCGEFSGKSTPYALPSEVEQVACTECCKKKEAKEARLRWSKNGQKYEPGTSLINQLKPGAWVELRFNPYSKKYQANVYPSSSSEPWVSIPASLDTTKKRAMAILQERGLVVEND